jgi:hypothetical protein
MRHAVDGVGLALIVWGMLWAATGLVPLGFALFNGLIGSYAVYDNAQGGQGAFEAAVVFLGSSVFWIAVGVFVTGIGLVSAFSGVGVRQRRPLSRWVAILVGALSLPTCPPFGLLFGIYVLYVLLDRETAQDFAPDHEPAF